ncbi:MAG: hypothetical protein MUQ25_02500 [Candidatus Aminicenantes bacterium]|nr:hypothetical protein [Candidatus Aminicenantes bacterium]
MGKNENLVFQQVSQEQLQRHETRKPLFFKLKKELGRPLISFFTSFRYPVLIEDNDVSMLEAVLQKTDMTSGFALIISSPGGDSLASERIINCCRSYSKTGEFWAIVPAKAKSAATMCVFRAIPASHSDGSRPPVPSEGGQPFRPEAGHFLAGIGMGGRNASEWRKSVKKTDGGGLFGVRCLFIPPGEGDTDARGETDDEEDKRNAPDERLGTVGPPDRAQPGDRQEHGQ